MSKKPKATANKQNKPMLERENKVLRLEVAYLKKLRAFRENPDAFLPRKAQAAITFELKEEGLRLKDVLTQVEIPEATYHYQIKQMKQADSNET
ncbi:hypothetical protein WKH57_11175 [Niallia taxi]|uniref:hypothetical protein n=1 Tax=Niallia taxi TaxID=2499688 RepID=UPI00316C5430